MTQKSGILTTLPRDLSAGLVVVLVALPLCLGVALASKPEVAKDASSSFFVPPLSGLIAGVIGGIVLTARHADPASTGCQHLGTLVSEISRVINQNVLADYSGWNGDRKEAFADSIAKANVQRVASAMLTESHTLRELVDSGSIKVVGCLYDVRTGRIVFEE